jgi:hypothetical protein
MGTWQKRVDPLAATFLEIGLKNLRKNLANPATATNQATIATTFLLAMHEVELFIYTILTLDIQCVYIVVESPSPRSRRIDKISRRSIRHPSRHQTKPIHVRSTICSQRR